MLTKEKLYGVWAGLSVPWTEEDRFDEAAFRTDIRSCIDVGVHGIYTGGTTGEFFALSDAEFKAITKTLIEETGNSNCRIQIGCTDLYTRGVIEKMEYAASLGAQAIQLAIPFWIPMSDEEIFSFFKDLYNAVPSVSVIIYHNRNAKREFTVDQIRRIIEVNPNLVGIKHNCFSLENTREFVEKLPELSIFVGEDNFFECMKFGVRGCYSSLVTLNPHLLLQLYDLCAKGDFEKAAVINERMLKLFEGFSILSKKGYRPHAIDRCLGSLNGFLKASLRVREPFESVSEEDYAILKKWVEKNVPEFLKLEPMEL